MTKLIFKEPHCEPLVYDLDVNLDLIMQQIGEEDFSNLRASSLGCVNPFLENMGYHALAFYSTEGGSHPCPNIRAPRHIEGRQIGEVSIVNGPTVILLTQPERIQANPVEGIERSTRSFQRVDIDRLFHLLSVLNVDTDEETEERMH